MVPIENCIYSLIFNLPFYVHYAYMHTFYLIRLDIIEKHNVDNYMHSVRNINFRNNSYKNLQRRLLLFDDF